MPDAINVPRGLVNEVGVLESGNGVKRPEFVSALKEDGRHPRPVSAGPERLFPPTLSDRIRGAIAVLSGRVRLSEKPQEAAPADASAPRQILVDRVWSSSTGEGEEYWCLRLTEPYGDSDVHNRKFGSPPHDSSYRLIAAARISLTLHYPL